MDRTHWHNGSRRNKRRRAFPGLLVVHFGSGRSFVIYPLFFLPFLSLLLYTLHHDSLEISHQSSHRIISSHCSALPETMLSPSPEVDLLYCPLSILSLHSSSPSTSFPPSPKPSPPSRSPAAALSFLTRRPTTPPTPTNAANPTAANTAHQNSACLS